MDDRISTFDRHGLVTAIWLPIGLVAVALFKAGFGTATEAFVAAGFAVVLLGFVGHIIVNAVYKTLFTPKEIAVGLLAYVLGLLMFIVAVLAMPLLRDRFFILVSLGMILIAAVAVLYMIIQLGLRQAFESFDVIRQFRPRQR